MKCKGYKIIVYSFEAHICKHTTHREDNLHTSSRTTHFVCWSVRRQRASKHHSRESFHQKRTLFSVPEILALL